MGELDAVYVLWLRDLKRYMRAKSRVFGSIGMPFFFLAFFSLGFRRVEFPGVEIDYVSFISPGIAAMVVLFTGVFSGVSVVWDRQFGFLREIMVSPASRFSIALGRALGGATTAFVQGLIMVGVSMLIGFRPSGNHVILFPVLLFLTALTFTSIGIAISTVMRDIHGFQIVVNFFVFPIFFLSGALFPLSELPGFVEALALLNPLSYSVDALRWSTTGYAFFNPVLSMAVIVLSCIIFLLLSSFLFSRTEVE